MSASLQMITMNIHKGFSTLDKNFVIHQLREAFRQVSSDLIFLQEVQGEHSKRAIKHPNWPENSQYEFLADSIWTDFAYAKNATYPHGHHGNAILSKYPILNSVQTNLSVNRFEKRGLLHCEITIPSTDIRLQAICVHLNLLHRDRMRQYDILRQYIDRSCPGTQPLILAGDFNDWSQKAKHHLVKDLGLLEAFEECTGRHARTFPSMAPVLPLDRIYIRGMRARDVQVLKGNPWKDLSDHIALWADLEFINNA